jgi:hypothetical protein
MTRPAAVPEFSCSASDAGKVAEQPPKRVRDAMTPKSIPPDSDAPILGANPVTNRSRSLGFCPEATQYWLHNIRIKFGGEATVHTPDVHSLEG